MTNLLIPIFCDVDDFCKLHDEYCKNHLISAENQNNSVFSSTTMSLSEVMTITIYFHLSNYRTFKWYYKNYVCVHLKSYFPKLLSYNRFVEVMQEATIPLLLYTLKFKRSKCDGISFIDSTIISVCHERRILSHKVFKNIAQRGKSSTGWFYGFKLHLVINDKGELISFCLTAGNVDDRNPNVVKRLCKELFGKLFADKGYLSQKIFEDLFSKGITLVTKIKKNMKNKLMSLYDKLLLRKRAIIESTNDFLKNMCQIEHSRHRCHKNFLVNLISGLAAYSFLPKKPSLHLHDKLLLN